MNDKKLQIFVVDNSLLSSLGLTDDLSNGDPVAIRCVEKLARVVGAPDDIRVVRMCNMDEESFVSDTTWFAVSSATFPEVADGRSVPKMLQKSVSWSNVIKMWLLSEEPDQPIIKEI